MKLNEYWLGQVLIAAVAIISLGLYLQSQAGRGNCSRPTGI